MRIGIDFDNTIAGYDGVFQRAAEESGLLPAGHASTKVAVRKAVLRLDGGENKWQRLQGQVYGARMAEAEMIDGVGDFFNACRNHAVPVLVISHKSEYGHFDPERVNFRDAAWAWMEDRGFFDDSGYGLARENVFFEATRAEKIARIKALDCTHFIDDLEEIFLDPEFPENTQRFLLGPGTPWPAITKAVFDA